MNAANPDADDPRDFVLSRWLDAPRALVFKAWTDPRHLAGWWGPVGFTVPVCELDARPGGAIRMVMRSDDGVDFPLRGTFIEVAEPERLVYRADWSEHPAGFFAHLREALGRTETEAERRNTVTVSFEEHGGRTRLTIRTRFESAEVRRASEQIGMSRGWSSSLDRLEESLLVASGTADRVIVQSRVYDAPRNVVWDAWTDPAQVVKWWGPNGFRNTIEIMDVRAGGQWKFIMHGPDGVDYPTLIRYLEVVKPERLVYTVAPAMTPTPHDEPAFHVTVHFDDEGDRTRVTMRALWDRAAQRDDVVRKHGAIEGGKQTMARLAAYLANEEIP